MKWNQEKIKEHSEAARRLNIIKDKAFLFINNNKKVREYDVQQYILSEFKEKKLKTTELTPIVAFRNSTSYVHYHPSQYSRKLKPESLILIDVWARLDKQHTPFADITWMGYYGKKIPKEIQEVLNLVIKARDSTINYIKKSLKNNKMPIGKEVDAAARDIITKAGYEKEFSHSTGHSLGSISAHGRELGITFKNNNPLKKNVVYTIEPGIYLKNKFGVRSEIDFYINNKMKIIITTKQQREIKLFKNYKIKN